MRTAAMGNIFNADFRDFLTALHQHEVRYLLVGGYSVILHGYSRTTGDLDIWVEKSLANYNQLVRAFQTFGMPTFDMSADNFLNRPDYDVFTFGRPSVAIDIITTLKGLDFAEAYPLDLEVEGVTVRLINYEHLLQAKRAAARVTGTTWTICLVENKKGWPAVCGPAFFIAISLPPTAAGRTD